VLAPPDDAGTTDAPPHATSSAVTHRLTPKHWRWLEFGCLLVATALAAGLVLYHLGTRQIWVDEGDTFATASQHGLTLWHWALNDGGNMVAYYLGMHFWTEVFGTSEVALRLPSALAAIATVPAGYVMLRRLFDARAAVFGAFFLAASLAVAWWAQTARGYVVAVFFVTCAGALLTLAVETRRRAAYIAFVVVSLFAVYTILLSALVIGTQACTVLFRRRADIEWKRVIGAGTALVVLSAPVAAAAMIRGTAPVSWLARPGPVFGAGDKYLVKVMASADITATPATTEGHYLFLAMIAAWALGAVLFVLSLVRTGRSRESWGYVLLFSWMVLPVVASYVISVAIHPVLSDRYILGVVPAASMLAGVACSRLRPWPLAVAAGVVLVVMRTWAVVPALGRPLEDWRTAVNTVVDRSKPHDCIAFFVSDGFDSFDYYALRLPPTEHGPLPTPVLPDTSWQSRAPYVLDPASISPERWKSVRTSCPRLWLVLTHQGPSADPGPSGLAYQRDQYDNRVALIDQIIASYGQTYHVGIPGLVLTLYTRRVQ
jgi:hypothetical protein